MISDEQLNSLAILCGIVMFTLILVYHAIFSSTKKSVLKAT
ncbi:LANO_0H04533g1_1 [Lachancea nothofagi CBS 11611]|uniref:LANO_0H04533g1_1 n=1 Tax=Lachancea nothofagi CBS 11611 TaxID=1266666 RepID=A0A1G4KLM5_9SACH|nr:LANO_0H04533g1_1 [Lachancea nothofagi CBS 11611]